jgi:hypothetical protein
MKVDQLIKVLENVKIDENKIDKDERRKIAEYLARILSFIDLVHIRDRNIMTKDKKIYDIESYEKLLKSNKISPNDAYVYVFFLDIYYLASYYFPFLIDKHLLADAYLSKLGFEYHNNVAPATGLKYVAVAIRYININHVAVEVADIDTATINMNLPKLIRGILDTKYIDDHKVKDITSELKSRPLFAGYNFGEAWRTLYRYYDDHDTSLAKEVEAIKDAYNRIFQPYRIVYDLNTKQFQVSGNNEDR